MFMELNFPEEHAIRFYKITAVGYITLI